MPHEPARGAALTGVLCDTRRSETFAANSLMTVVSFLLTPDVPASVLFTNNSCSERPRATRDRLRAREINGRCQNPHVRGIHPDANQALSVAYACCRRTGRFESQAPTAVDRSSKRCHGPKFEWTDIRCRISTCCRVSLKWRPGTTRMK